MTVKELIAQLIQMPPDMPVRYDGYYDTVDIKVVYIDDENDVVKVE